MIYKINTGKISKPKKFETHNLYKNETAMKMAVMLSQMFNKVLSKRAISRLSLTNPAAYLYHKDISQIIKMYQIFEEGSLPKPKRLANVPMFPEISGHIAILQSEILMQLDELKTLQLELASLDETYIPDFTERARIEELIDICMSSINICNIEISEPFWDVSDINDMEQIIKAKVKEHNKLEKQLKELKKELRN